MAVALLNLFFDLIPFAWILSFINTIRQIDFFSVFDQSRDYGFCILTS